MSQPFFANVTLGDGQESGSGSIGNMTDELTTAGREGGAAGARGKARDRLDFLPHECPPPSRPAVHEHGTLREWLKASREALFFEAERRRLGVCQVTRDLFGSLSPRARVLVLEFSDATAGEVTTKEAGHG